MKVNGDDVTSMLLTYCYLSVLLHIGWFYVRSFQEFGLARFKTSVTKTMKGFEYVLARMQGKLSVMITSVICNALNAGTNVS